MSALPFFPYSNYLHYTVNMVLSMYSLVIKLNYFTATTRNLILLALPRAPLLTVNALRPKSLLGYRLAHYIIMPPRF